MIGGVRFRIFPQEDEGWVEPETVTVSLPPGAIGPGPADYAMHTILPVDKREPYDPPHYLPPYRGACLPPAQPDSAGHFDHIAVDDPQFLSAHMYACVRRTLDAWEVYLGGPIRWWHAEMRPQMELVAHVEWDNAQSGMGFIEAGGKPNGRGEMRLFALNFDVMAHETGHAILFSTMGAPRVGRPAAIFLAFHESFSDLVSMIAALHFPSVIHRLLSQTNGDLYALNMLSRIGEMSGAEQVRIADNTERMRDVEDIHLGPDGDWVDPSGQDRNAHALGQPLTGAMFDLLIEVFQDGLVARGALPRATDARGWSRDGVEARLSHIGYASARAYAAFARAFEASLAHARDVLGFCMARVMRRLHPEDLSFGEVAACVIEGAIEQGLEHLLPDMLEIFLVRDIDPRPHLRQGRQEALDWRRLPYGERARRVAAARGGAPGCVCNPHEIMAVNRVIRRNHRRLRADAPA